MASVNACAAGKQSLGEGRPAVVLQWAEHRINRRGSSAYLVAGCWRDGRATVITDQVEALRGECAREIRGAATCAATHVLSNDGIPRIQHATVGYTTPAIGSSVPRDRAVGDGDRPGVINAAAVAPAGPCRVAGNGGVSDTQCAAARIANAATIDSVVAGQSTVRDRQHPVVVVNPTALTCGGLGSGITGEGAVNYLQSASTVVVSAAAAVGFSAIVGDGASRHCESPTVVHHSATDLGGVARERGVSQVDNTTVVVKAPAAGGKTIEPAVGKVARDRAIRDR